MGFLGEFIKANESKRQTQFAAEQSMQKKPEGNRNLWREVFGATNKEDAHNRTNANTRGTRSLSSSDAAFKRLLLAMRSNAPGNWSDDRWEQTQHYSGFPYVAIERIGKMLSQAEFQVYVEDPSVPDGKRPVTPDDPPQGDRICRPWDLVKRLKRPNRQDSFGMLVWRWTQQLKLTGQALTWLVPNQLGDPFEFYCIPTCLAIPQAIINEDYPEGYWRIQPVYPYGPFSTWPTPNTAVGAPIDARWMMRMMYPHPLLRYDGYSPLTGLNLQIDEIEQMDRSRFYKMKRSINPSAVLQMKELEGAEQLPESEIERLRADIENLHEGPENHGNLIVPPPGAALEEFGRSPVDMDYQSGWDQLASFILGGGFGITKTAAGMIEDNSYATLFATLKQLYWTTIDPDCAFIGAHLTRDVAPYFGDNLIVEVRCKPINDHEIAFSKIDKLASLKGQPKKVIILSLQLMDMPVDMELVAELANAQAEGQQGGMPGMGGEEEMGEKGPEGIGNEEGAKESEREEPKEVTASRPNPGNLNRGSLGPRKLLDILEKRNTRIEKATLDNGRKLDKMLRNYRNGYSRNGNGRH